MAELRQFVGFMLAQEHYGIDIMAVEEIIRMVDITPVPRAPAFVEGIINMRGRVIPIVDLRKKLIEVDAIDKAPGTSPTIDNYINGVARTSKCMVIILDIFKVFSIQEQMALDSLA